MRCVSGRLRGSDVGLPRRRRPRRRLARAEREVVAAEVGDADAVGCDPQLVDDVARDPLASDEDEIRREMDGYLCRCGAAPRIVKAILRAAGSEE